MSQVVVQESALAEQVELAFGQIPKYTGHSTGGFMGCAKGGSSPIVRVGGGGFADLVHDQVGAGGTALLICRRCLAHQKACTLNKGEVIETL